MTGEVTKLGALTRAHALGALVALRDGYTGPTGVLLRWMEAAGYQGFTPECVRDWGEYLRHEQNGRILSANSRNMYVKTLKHRVKWLMARASVDTLSDEDRGRVEAALADLKYDDVQQRPMDEDRYFTEDEVRQLVAYAAAQHPRMALIIQFLAEQGTRISETLAIRTSDCSLQGDSVRIVLHGKGSKRHVVKDRSVYISRAFYRRIRQAFGGKPFLFCWGKRGESYTRNYASMWIHRASGVCFGKARGAHTLRHSWFTKELHDRPGELVEVSRYGGHASTSTTLNTYAHGGWGAADARVKLPNYDPQQVAVSA